MRNVRLRPEVDRKRLYIIDDAGERVYLTKDAVNAQPYPVFKPTEGVLSPF